MGTADGGGRARVPDCSARRWVRAGHVRPFCALGRRRSSRIEVTAAADPDCVELWKLMNGSDERWIEDGLRGGWFVSLYPRARVRRLRSELPGLLRRLENDGAAGVYDPRRSFGPTEALAADLGIASLHQVGTDFPGSIYITIETTSIAEPDGPMRVPLSLSTGLGASYAPMAALTSDRSWGGPAARNATPSSSFPGSPRTIRGRQPPHGLRRSAHRPTRSPSRGHACVAGQHLAHRNRLALGASLRLATLRQASRQHTDALRDRFRPVLLPEQSRHCRPRGVDDRRVRAE